jgi:predicted MFS family arabinose efflux permease
MSSGVVSTYSATLIRNFGFSSKHAALLNMPSGLVSILSTLCVGYGISRKSNRWAWFVGCCVPGVMGSALMSFLPQSNVAGRLVGIYLVSFITPTVMIVYDWTAANTKTLSRTARSYSVTLMGFSFGVGNIIGPQTFRAQDAPQYLPAKITVLITQSISAVLAIVLAIYYVRSNTRREQKYGY